MQTGNVRALDAGEAGAEEAGHHATWTRRGNFCTEARRERETRVSQAQDTPLMRALGLAHHWQRLLDERRAASVAEIAEAEGIDLGQASKMSRLAQLAPDPIECIARPSRGRCQPPAARQDVAFLDGAT